MCLNTNTAGKLALGGQPPSAPDILTDRSPAGAHFLISLIVMHERPFCIVGAMWQGQAMCCHRYQVV